VEEVVQRQDGTGYHRSLEEIFSAFGSFLPMVNEARRQELVRAPGLTEEEYAELGRLAHVQHRVECLRTGIERWRAGNDQKS